MLDHHLWFSIVERLEANTGIETTLTSQERRRRRNRRCRSALSKMDEESWATMVGNMTRTSFPSVAEK